LIIISAFFAMQTGRPLKYRLAAQKLYEKFAGRDAASPGPPHSVAAPGDHETLAKSGVSHSVS